jgi:hypothetical protein
MQVLRPRTSSNPKKPKKGQMVFTSFHKMMLEALIGLSRSAPTNLQKKAAKDLQFPKSTTHPAKLTSSNFPPDPRFAKETVDFFGFFKTADRTVL